MALFAGLTVLSLISKASGIGSFLVKNWQMVLIIALLAAGGIYHMKRTATIHSLEKQVIAKEEEIAELELNLASCNGAINNQNEIIDTLRDTGKQILAEERNRASLKIAEIEAKRKADLATLRSKPLATSCEAAMQELLDFAIGGNK